MMMPGRQVEIGVNYRYGFNGKENDNEVKGEGNQQDYGMRIYDPRLGKFLSVDPLDKNYPSNSPYSFAENEPIANIDLDGKEKKNTIMGRLATGIRKATNETVGSIKKTFSKETANDIKATAVDVAKMSIGDPDATKDFSRRMTNFSLGINRFVLSYTSQPINWIFTIPNRTQDENLVGLGYGIGKAVEMYVLFKVPELFEEEGGSVGVSSLNRSETKIRVDLMGGEHSRYNGFINFDVKAVTGIADDVINFETHFSKNSVVSIIVDNPRAEFVKYISGSVEEGGTVTVRGNMNNPYFKAVYQGKAAGMEDFEVTVMKPNVPNVGYKKTSGEDITGQINEIQLKKKTKK